MNGELLSVRKGEKVIAPEMKLIPHMDAPYQTTLVMPLRQERAIGGVSSLV